MARVTTKVRIDRGPSKWDLMLNIFDPMPSDLLEFTSGDLIGLGDSCQRVAIFVVGERGAEEIVELVLEILGVRKPKSPDDKLWTITARDAGTEQLDLPEGYCLPPRADDPDGEFEIHYDPVRRRGWIEFELRSLCHEAPISIVRRRPASHEFGAEQYRCLTCGAEVLTRTGSLFPGMLRWLDGSDEETHFIRWLPEYVG